jgi:hypothetical protein
MRTIRVFLVASAVALFSALTVPTFETISAPAPVLAQDPPGAKAPDIDVRITDDGDDVWYLDPVALAIGAGVIIVFLALFAMAGRGGGTTIIREK